jgi:hypothetical protein
MRRREFIAGLGGAAASAGLPLAARAQRAQQPVLPVVGLVSARARRVGDIVWGERGLGMLDFGGGRSARSAWPARLGDLTSLCGTVI